MLVVSRAIDSGVGARDKIDLHARHQKLRVDLQESQRSSDKWQSVFFQGGKRKKVDGAHNDETPVSPCLAHEAL